MAIFFFMIGLEIKRELMAGELNSPSTGNPAPDSGGWGNGFADYHIPVTEQKS